jgi:TfoX/Sxy family transcriptional regulator of competence genes
MKFPRADPRAVARFEGLVPAADDVVVRPMFGHPAAFVTGNMFLGVFGDSVFLRLSETDRPAGLRLAGAHLFEPMPGRPMREYVVLPPALADDRTLARPWVDRSLRYARGLPPKMKKVGPPKRPR